MHIVRRRRWHPTPVLLPGKSHGRKSLVGYSPWSREESDTTEQLPFHFSLSCIGEGNGNPLQCSCLENPRDTGAWWAAVYGVTQSRTRLKWLSKQASNAHCYKVGRGRDLGGWGGWEMRGTGDIGDWIVWYQEGSEQLPLPHKASSQVFITTKSL